MKIENTLNLKDGEYRYTWSGSTVTIEVEPHEMREIEIDIECFGVQFGKVKVTGNVIESIR